MKHLTKQETVDALKSRLKELKEQVLSNNRKND